MAGKKTNKSKKEEKADAELADWGDLIDEPEDDPVDDPPKKKAARKAAKDNKPKVKKVKQPMPALSLYRRIAFSFVILTAILLAVVIYLSLLRAEITVFPSKEDMEVEFIADVVEAPATDNEVEGRVLSTLVEQGKEFMVSGEGGTEVPGKAGGLVTIYNTTGNNQPLVATTRLLTSEGILFRIDEGVVAPAGGSVEVMAHADVEGAAGDIGPSKFIIPGLNAALQESIYAESTEAMTGGVRTIAVVSADELSRAESELSAEMLEAAKTELLAMIGDRDYTGQAFFSEIIEKVSDTVPGTESDSFTIELKLRSVGVFYDREKLKELALDKLYESLSSGKELVEVNFEEMEVEVEKYDVESAMANLRVKLGGQTVLSSTSEILNKDVLVGLNEEELKKRLEGFESVDYIEISFFPFWVRKIPSLKDHIDIIVEEAK